MKKVDQIKAVVVPGPELTVIQAKEPLSKGSHRIEAKLGEGGKLSLTVDGRPVAEGKDPGWLVGQPADDFTVGDDGNAAFGEYESPNAFAGKVTNVRVQVP